jgi:hypothetical protein
MIAQKVTKPEKRVTDAQVLAHLARKGMNPEYVEFVEDYSAKRPNIKLYCDRLTGHGIAVVQQEPRVLPDGQSIDTTWHEKGKDSWQCGVNAYIASVSGTKVIVTVPGQGKTQWDPVVTLDGKPVSCKPAVLRATPEGKADVMLEWDYSICRRWLHNRRTGIREFWLFDADPGGEVVIDPRSDGNLTPDDYFCHDADGHPVEGFTADKAGIKGVRFPKGTRFPCVMDDSLSVYMPSAFGRACVKAPLGTWSNCRNAASGDAYDTGVRAEQYARNDGQYHYYRGFVGFDTSGLPDAAIVGTLEFWLYALNGSNADKNSITLHIYNGMPTCPHAPVVYADFGLSQYTSGLGTVTCDSIPASGTGYSGSFLGWKQASLTAAAIASVNPTGYTKWMLVTEYDHNNDETTYDAGDTNIWSWKSGTYTSEEYGAKLIVEYVLSAQEVRTDCVSGVSS